MEKDGEDRVLNVFPTYYFSTLNNPTSQLISFSQVLNSAGKHQLESDLKREVGDWERLSIPLTCYSMPDFTSPKAFFF